MFNIFRFAPTREQSIRRIVGSLFLMVFGIFMICIFSKVIGLLSILVSSIITLYHIYFLLVRKNSLSSLEIKITTGKLPYEDENK